MATDIFRMRRLIRELITKNVEVSMSREPDDEYVALVSAFDRKLASGELSGLHVAMEFLALVDLLVDEIGQVRGQQPDQVWGEIATRLVLADMTIGEDEGDESP